MTTQDSAANPFEYWREMFQKSTEAWAQAAGTAGNPFWAPFSGAAPGGVAPGFGPTPGSNPFGQFMPPFFANDMQQMWQQFFNSWAEQVRQNTAPGTPGPEVIFNAQKQLSEQLESMAKVFAEVMGTESFTSMLGKYMEQSLHWQEQMARQTEPQLGAILRAFNMPSRGQIDRMIERVIGLEERLDDQDDENRKLRAQVEAAVRTPAPRARSRAPETPLASSDKGTAPSVELGDRPSKGRPSSPAAFRRSEFRFRAA